MLVAMLARVYAFSLNLFPIPSLDVCTNNLVVRRWAERFPTKKANKCAQRAMAI